MDYHSSEGGEKKVENVLKAGCEITGSAIGGAMGFFMGGPLGAATAGAIGTATGGLLADVATRILSRREKVRIGATAQYAYDQIQQNIERGKQVRQDSFMKPLASGRAPFQEIFEGVLLKAQREHEEKKLRYIGQFFANVAFDRYCSAEQANYLLTLLERLTYQQLVMIRTFRPLDLSEVRVSRRSDEDLMQWEKDLIKRRKDEQSLLRDGLRETMRSGTISSDRYVAYAALFELFRLGIVAHKNHDTGLEDEPPQYMIRINFASTFSTAVGELIHSFCGLETIPIEDVMDLKNILDYTAPIQVYVTRDMFQKDEGDEKEK